MAYTFQTFSVGQEATEEILDAVEVNIRDHVHGAAGVSYVPDSSVTPNPSTANFLNALFHVD